MRALIDTHTFLWFMAGDPKLSMRARRLIEDPANDILVSITSLLEIAIKTGLGKLALDKPFGELIPEQLAQNAVKLLDLRFPHLATLAGLPLHHRDPFDRLIIAQAITEGLPVVSVDQAFDAYPVQRIW